MKACGGKLAVCIATATHDDNTHLHSRSLFLRSPPSALVSTHPPLPSYPHTHLCPLIHTPTSALLSTHPPLPSYPHTHLCPLIHTPTYSATSSSGGLTLYDIVGSWVDSFYHAAAVFPRLDDSSEGRYVREVADDPLVSSLLASLSDNLARCEASCDDFRARCVCEYMHVCHACTLIQIMRVPSISWPVHAYTLMCLLCYSLTPPVHTVFSTYTHTRIRVPPLLIHAHSSLAGTPSTRTCGTAIKRLPSQRSARARTSPSPRARTS